MRTHSSRLLAHFNRVRGRHASASFGTRSLFRSQPGHSAAPVSQLAEEIQRLASDLNEQGSALSGITSAISGGTSSLEKAATSLTGGSLLSAIADSAKDGFSWKTILKDVLPFGGLISDVTNLFRSPHVPAPLQQYDAPASLGFSGVLGSDGRIAQASTGADGFTRASTPGLDLSDAIGGPQPAYSRRANGSLGEAAGAPASRYSGVLDLTTDIRGLVNAGEASGQQRAAMPSPSPQADAQRAEERLPSAAETGANTNYQTPKLPSFDSSWFMDHAPYIAAAVRNAMLDSHPILDVINDL